MNGNPMQFLMQMMANGGNPQQILQNMMQNNPQMRGIFNQAKNSGLSMEQYARQYAKQNGIDIEQMINNMKKMGARFN